MIIDINMLKNYPVTCLNRDDTGSPKTVMYGSALRSRISSQCLKRVWRTSDMLTDIVGKSSIGQRTRNLPGEVYDKLIKDGISEEFAAKIKEILCKFGTTVKESKDKDEATEQPEKATDANETANNTADTESAGKKTSGKKNAGGKKKDDDCEKTAQIILYSEKSVNAIADVVKELLAPCQSVKDVEKISYTALMNALQKAEVDCITLDMALFGRMVTSSVLSNVEASMSVAHAFSTNRVHQESDYFTAVDDLMKPGESGAAILDQTDYNASCYYLYASIDTDKLAENLKSVPNGEMLKEIIIPLLIKVMANVNPKGHSHGMPGNVQARSVLIECRDRSVPVDHSEAFSKPVIPTDEYSLLELSSMRLVKDCKALDRAYDTNLRKRIWMTMVEDARFDDGFTLEFDNLDKALAELPSM